ncbi:MAG: thiol protease/hemagglutinin PrtT [Dysgonamonadaceae bacterium]|jgi:hypothetical protein|nr:thiol protease/hemagglutinin PrtT [Dysgonamonadaceae bacterium]
MMKRLFFNLLIFFCCVVGAEAKSITETEASQIARAFVKEQFTLLRNADNQDAFYLDMIYAPSMPSLRSTGGEQEKKVYYYVFNLNENGGFIIVAGDDRAKKILGYADTGSFEANRISENLKYWLSCYEEELELLSAYPEENAIATSEKEPVLKNSNLDFAPSVTPFVTALWNQNAPYNLDHPFISGTTTRATVGCTAIASAQIMHYYQWPKKGKGSVTHDNTTIDLSKATYNWNNIDRIYYPDMSSDDVKVKAVASFLYDVSFAAKSSYGPSTGATTRNMALALLNNFDYDSGLQVYKRDYYTEQEWKDLIKTELNAARPMHYAGYSSDYTGGHAFVCDGYDTNGLFHFNWGWGGQSNGYFELSALNPGALGAGAGTGVYNRGQEIIAGIQPPVDNSKTSYNFYCENLTLLSNYTINRNDEITIRINKIFNEGINTMESGEVRLCLSDENGTETIFGGKGITGIAPGKGWNSLERSGIIPSTVEEGTYKLYIVYKSNAQTDWTRLRGRIGTNDHFKVRVTANEVIFSDSDELPVLQVVADNSVQTVYKDKDSAVKVILKNTGKGDFNSFIALAHDQAKTNVFADLIPVVVAAGETKEYWITGKTSQPEGNIPLFVFYNEKNDYTEQTKLITPIVPVNVKILSLASDDIKIDLVSKISFPDNNNVTPATFNLEVKIKNNGSYYEGHIYARAKGKSSEITSLIDSKVVRLNPNETTTIYFTSPPSIPYEEAEVAVYFYNPAKNQTECFPGSNGSIEIDYKPDKLTSIDDFEVSKGLKLFPNPVEDVLNISSEEKIQSILITDLFGKKCLENSYDSSNNASILVKSLNPGIYIIQIRTEKEWRKMKFLKK